MSLQDMYALPKIDFVGGSTQELSFHCYHHKSKRPCDMSFCNAEFSVVNYMNKNGAPLVVKPMDIREGATKEGMEYALATKISSKGVYLDKQVFNAS